MHIRGTSHWPNIEGGVDRGEENGEPVGAGLHLHWMKDSTNQHAILRSNEINRYYHGRRQIGPRQFFFRIREGTVFGRKARQITSRRGEAAAQSGIQWTGLILVMEAARVANVLEVVAILRSEF